VVIRIRNLLIVLGLLSTIFVGFLAISKLFSTSSSNNNFQTYTENRSSFSFRETCESSHGIDYLKYSDTEGANNKFGLYVYAENKDFIRLAAKLVNSNGGDWGYVLIPFNIEDRDYTKWREVFDLLHDKHLIPIVQLHASNLDDIEEETLEAAVFLDEFLWPIKTRYISVYNEPNDRNFWFGKLDPAGYAALLDHTIRTFKEISTDYYMMNGAFNVSAISNGTTLDAFDYMYRMNLAVPGIFNKLDGWASHSYPQPNFAGNPHASGRNSIRAYETELAFLKNSLGVTNDYEVFITETGWAHAEGQKAYDASFLPVKSVAQNFKIAYEQYWLKDNRVKAVTPFTIWYDAPFDHFSWVNSDKVPYLHYNEVKSLKKVAGEPQMLVSERINTTKCLSL
jgi:hypothetical protein